MAFYVLLLNDSMVDEFESDDIYDAMHQAIDLTRKHRPKDDSGSVRWGLARKGSDGQPGDRFMQWGSIVSGDSGPYTS